MRKRNDLNDIGTPLDQLFTYKEGSLIWKQPPDQFFDNPRSIKGFVTRFVGKQAGRKTNEYREIGIRGKRYAEHRIVYFLHTGEQPEYVDHIDGNPLNNRFENLRAATNSTNQANAKMRHDNSSGYKGVSWHKDKQKWRATITVDGKSIHLGLFENLADAVAIRKHRAETLFGEFIDHDR